MVAFYLQNTSKMVKNFIIILLFSISIFSSKGQRFSIESEIDLSVNSSKDTVCIGDSLIIILSYENKTKADIIFFPNAIIGITHYHPDKFISYDTPQRIIYRLNNVCSNVEYINLKPEEVITKTYGIIADSNFFYEGDNIVLAFYHFYNKPLNKKRRRLDKSPPVLSLWSSPVKIYIELKKTK